MKLLPALLFFVFAATASARDFRPESHMEIIPAANSSVQECYVFRTTAGVHYTVESSNDLTHWTSEEEIYGLGNEYVVTMREFTPPPPPPPGSPPVTFPPPAKNVSIRMERCSAAGGGTVVSWPSLDHAGPITVRIAGEMVPEWFQVPLYFERFANYYFFVWHPNAVASPPAVNSILGANDSAMLAVLEASLPAMNGQVTTSVAAARNAPVPTPVPVDPDSRRFWRILVDSGIDTDSDGTPDWSEFEMAAREAAAPPPLLSMNGIQTSSSSSGGGGGSTASADPYNPDTNDDGIPDGDQLDGDRDGIVDGKDIALEDNTAVFTLGPLPRYALFPITNASSSEWLLALQMSDKGTVLYETGTWTGGVWTSLQAPSEDPWFLARAINDHDVILGAGRNTIREDPELTAAVICSWASPQASPQFLKIGTGASATYACSSYNYAYNMLHPGSVLSNDGHFFAPVYRMEDDEFVFQHHSFWSLPSAGQPASEVETDAEFFWNQGPGLRWGYRWEYEPVQSYHGLVSAESALPELPFVPINVLAHPESPMIALPGIDSVAEGMALIDGQWKASPTYATASDISADGTAIGRNNSGIIAPILIGGEWTHLENSTPDLPAPWLDSTVKLLDTTPGGWILAQRGNYPEPDFDYAAMLPVRVEARFTGSDGVARTKAAGVDDFSIGSYASGDAVQDRIWIMAPMNEDKGIVFKSPLNDKTPLVISADGIGFPTFPTTTLNTPEAPIDIRALSSGTSGDETTLDLKMGPEESSVTSLSSPVGIKVMKNRVVKVRLYKVTKQTAGQPDNTADQTPGDEELEDYLNDVFSPQINVRFDVTYAPAPLVLDWDVNLLAGDANTGNGMLNCGLTIPSFEQNNILSARPADRPISDIDVFLIGTNKYIDGKDWGATLRIDANVNSNAQVNGCWIVGDALDNREMGKLGQTIAHEIGHILVGYGHPNVEQSQSKGPAPLPGTRHSERLMVSGTGYSILRGHMLVKGEWDEANNWLEDRPAGDN